MHFLERLQNSFKKKRGAENRQRALDEEIARLPSNTHSPVWHIKGESMSEHILDKQLMTA